MRGGDDANITLAESLFPPNGDPKTPVMIGIYEANDPSLTDDEMLDQLYENILIHDRIVSECVVRNVAAADQFITMFKKAVGG